jgi:hypothetical protein
MTQGPGRDINLKIALLNKAPQIENLVWNDRLNSVFWKVISIISGQRTGYSINKLIYILIKSFLKFHIYVYF